MFEPLCPQFLHSKQEVDACTTAAVRSNLAVTAECVVDDQGNFILMNDMGEVIGVIEPRLCADAGAKA